MESVRVVGVWISLMGEFARDGNGCCAINEDYTLSYLQ